MLFISIISYSCFSCVILGYSERLLVLWHYNSCHFLRAYYGRANTVFVWFNSFNPHNSPLRWDLLLFSFYRQGKWSTWRLSNLPKVILLVTGLDFSSNHLSRKFLCYTPLYLLYRKLFFKLHTKKNDTHQSGHSRAISLKIMYGL